MLDYPKPLDRGEPHQETSLGSPSVPVANRHPLSDGRTAQLKRLEQGEFAPFLSPYLMHGYLQDVAVLTKCEIGEGSIVGLIDMDSHFAAGDGFHLTVPLTTVWVAQLAIIYGCIDAGLPKKSGEAYLRKFEIQCPKPVRKLEAIEISLSLEARRSIPGHYFYKGRFAVERDHFLGRASFILPVA